LVIGVEDGIRAVKGIADPLDVEGRLSNRFSDGIAPLLVPEIHILAWRGTHLMVAEVHSSPGPIPFDPNAIAARAMHHRRSVNTIGEYT
jgi:hypothetical protein